MKRIQKILLLFIIIFHLIATSSSAQIEIKWEKIFEDAIKKLGEMESYALRMIEERNTRYVMNVRIEMNSNFNKKDQAALYDYKYLLRHAKDRIDDIEEPYVEKEYKVEGYIKEDRVYAKEKDKWVEVKDPLAVSEMKNQWSTVEKELAKLSSYKNLGVWKGQILGEENIDGKSCHIVELLPRDMDKYWKEIILASPEKSKKIEELKAQTEKLVHISKYWISKEDNHILKIEERAIYYFFDGEKDVPSIEIKTQARLKDINKTIIPSPF